MKGYMIKDLLLIKNQKRTLPLLLVCGFFMSFAMQPMVAVTYLAILGTMICVGTISYDEMDHGYSFLLALPPSRKTYVREYHFHGEPQRHSHKKRAESPGRPPGNA